MNDEETQIGVMMPGQDTFKGGKLSALSKGSHRDSMDSQQSYSFFSMFGGNNGASDQVDPM